MAALSLMRLFVVAVGLAIWPALTLAYDVPVAKQTKLGKYLTANDAAAVVTAERSQVLFLDIRTLSEVQYVGYTSEIDAVVPWVELSKSGDWDENAARLKLEKNDRFTPAVEKLLAAKGLSKDSKVVLICRSGDRTARAADQLAAAGYSNVYSVVDGFEGDLSSDGRRTVNGWKNAGLPWTYKLDKTKVLPPVN